jgi:spermidine synthase
MSLPALLSLICGFSSLSIEILWVRFYSYSQITIAPAFGFVLMAYLLGIAVGAQVGSRICRTASGDDALWRCSVGALALSAVSTVALPHAYGWVMRNGLETLASSTVLIASASAVLAFVFPIAHHLGADRQPRQQGRRFAGVYVANVAGAAAGPLVTGYLLLERLPLEQAFGAIALLQVVAAVLLTLRLGTIRHRGALLAGSAVVVLSCAATIHAQPTHQFVNMLNQPGVPAKTVVENRHGVVTIFAQKEGDDAVFGTNVYDGRTNLDPDLNTNSLERPLLMAALQPRPARVLVVGLSIGTWLALVNAFPGVEHVDVIEINPGYLQAAQAYPHQARALRDPRVHVIVDDARRWLRMNPDPRYDMVIMNTTLHWRANAGMLLSQEFLNLIRHHMAPDAVMTFNTTGSDDAFYTATRVFRHAYRYVNFVYAADFDFRGRKTTPQTRALYASLQLDGQPLFAPASPAIDRFMAQPFVTIEEVQRHVNRPLEMITDQNLITEYKYGRHLL